MSSLPEDIYLDILLRVPVKSTFVCKCVCKCWFSIISSTDFVKRHIDLTTQRNNCNLLVETFNGYRLYSSSSTESDAAAVVGTPNEHLTDRSTTLLGSCNGLVYGWNSLFKSYFLWNPATREYKRLPKSQSNAADIYRHLGISHGFGYDYKTDDYKLVEICHRQGIISVKVYSLKSDSWRSLQPIQYTIHYSRESGVPFNGALHWFGGILGKLPSNRIVSMNICEERFEELQLPITLQTTQPYRNMGVLERCLCVFARHKESFEVWVMQEYGVPASWTKLYTIAYGSIVCYPYYLELSGL